MRIPPNNAFLCYCYHFLRKGNQHAECTMGLESSSCCYYQAIIYLYIGSCKREREANRSDSVANFTTSSSIVRLLLPTPSTICLSPFRSLLPTLMQPEGLCPYDQELIDVIGLLYRLILSSHQTQGNIFPPLSQDGICSNIFNRHKYELPFLNSAHQECSDIRGAVFRIHRCIFRRIHQEHNRRLQRYII